MSRFEAIQNGIVQAAIAVDSDLPEDQKRLVQAPKEVNLPVLHPAFLHLWELFLLMGQCMQTGMGLVPVTWVELQAFLEVNELELTLWEKKVLKKMSDAYCAEASRATDINRPAPYTPKIENKEEDAIAKALQIRQNMRAFRGKK